eukprot:jgi/Botrbrau1/8825/Bobra.0335s0013.3
MGSSEDKSNGHHVLLAGAPTPGRAQQCDVGEAEGCEVSHTASFSTGQARLGDPQRVLHAAPRQNARWEELIAMLSMALLFGWVACGPWLTFGAMYAALMYQSPGAALFVALVVSLSLMPHGGYWHSFRHCWLWDTWRRYFNVRLITPPVPYLKQDRKYIFVHYPHSVFPMGSFLSLCLCGLPSTGLPDGMRAGIASILFHLPIVRQVYIWMGCFPAEKGLVTKYLEKGPVGLVPEGVAGIFYGADRIHERVFASKHKGYAKLALRSGADVVAVYQLGQSQMMSFWGSPRWSRKLRASVGFFWGRWGLPLLPRRHDIYTLVSEPIPGCCPLRKAPFLR